MADLRARSPQWDYLRGWTNKEDAPTGIEAPRTESGGSADLLDPNDPTLEGVATDVPDDPGHPYFQSDETLQGVATDLPGGGYDSDPTLKDVASDLPGGGWHDPDEPVDPHAQPNPDLNPGDTAYHGVGSLDYDPKLDPSTWKSPYTGPTEVPAASQHQPAAKMRAIRQPDGTFLYTNQGYGGEEYDTADAGKIGRMEGVDHMDHSAEAPHHTAAGPEFDNHPGVSMIEGTPDQQMNLQLERGQKRLIATSQQDQIRSLQQTPEERAKLANRDIQTALWVNAQYGPKLQQIEKERAQKVQAISTPGVEGYIPDEKARLAELGRINQHAKNETAYNVIMAQVNSGRNAVAHQ